MKPYLLFLIALLCFGCTGDGYTPELKHVDSLIGYDASQALRVLDSLQAESDGWGRSRKMRLELLRAKAQNRAFVPFTTDSVMKEVARYYNSHGTSNDRLQTQYLLGCAYRDMGEAPEALDTYYDAISMADTTSRDCDVSVLIGIYGQMADIFHKQNLPQDEIWALNHYLEYIRKTQDTLKYVSELRQLAGPYYLMGEKDTVLHLLHDTYEQLCRLGHRKEAVSTHGIAIYILTERGQLDDAGRLVEEFEHESGLFDSEGNIAKGREYHYCTRGFYELACGRLDAAESYFRKAIRAGVYDDAYKGLLAVFREKKIPDSVYLYSRLNEAALDTLHNQMQTNAVHQAAALYDYSRSQKMAEQEASKARKARLAVGVSLALLALLLYLLCKGNRRKKRDMQRLEDELRSAKSDLIRVREEQKKLDEEDFATLRAEKALREQELTAVIRQLQEKLHLPNDGKDDIEQFATSKIADLFTRKAEGKTERPVPTEAEWRMLQSQFSSDLPQLYNRFDTGKLSELEMRTCILLLLGMQENIIVAMTRSTSSSVSIAKARANEKLFKQKGAPTLKNNLTKSLSPIC